MQRAQLKKLTSENVVNEFLQKINHNINEDKQSAIKEFDQYFFKMHPKL